MRDCMSFSLHIRQSGRGMQAAAARREKGEEAFKAAMAAPVGELASVYRQMPIYYITNRMIVAAPGATIKWPRYSQEMDYELELGIVTKRTRANIPANEAGAHGPRQPCRECVRCGDLIGIDDVAQVGGADAFSA